MLPFNYHHLYYFYVIAKETSVSKAAKSLKVSQPALSAQLKHYENYLGLKLFERQGRNLTLTEDGRYILSYAETIFNAGRELMDGLGDRSHKGKIRIQIGISNSIPKAFAENFINTLRRMTPGIHLTVHEDPLETMTEALKIHALDLIVSDVPAKTSLDEGLQNFPVSRTPIVFCAHHSLAKKYRNIPRDLHKAPMIMPTAQSQIFHSVQDYFAAHKITPDILAEIHDVELVYRLVLSGAGIAPLSQWMLSNPEAREAITVLGPSKKNPIQETIYLILKKRAKPHPLTEKILQHFHLKPRS